MRRFRIIFGMIRYSQQQRPPHTGAKGFRHSGAMLGPEPSRRPCGSRHARRAGACVIFALGVVPDAPALNPWPAWRDAGLARAGGSAPPFPLKNRAPLLRRGAKKSK